MLDFPDLVRTRRSIRHYQDQPISREVIEELLTLAGWSPSAHNRQPWRFAVIITSATQQALAQAMNNRLRRDLQADHVPQDIIENDVARSYSRITGAAALICVCLSMADMDVYPDEKRASSERVMAIQSVAMAGHTLLLAAHHVGLGACWMCAPLFCPDVVQDVLALPDDWEPQALITLGYPAEERQRDRRPIQDFTLWR
jgi:F420 biosynthesis protein FbiB-like protein